MALVIAWTRSPLDDRVHSNPPSHFTAEFSGLVYTTNLTSILYSTFFEGKQWMKRGRMSNDRSDNDFASSIPALSIQHRLYRSCVRLVGPTSALSIRNQPYRSSISFIDPALTLSIRHQLRRFSINFVDSTSVLSVRDQLCRFHISFADQVMIWPAQRRLYRSGDDFADPMTRYLRHPRSLSKVIEPVITV